MMPASPRPPTTVTRDAFAAGIPADVLAEAWLAIYNDKNEYLSIKLARAILAERERCAGIAEMHDHRGDIAAAIRRSA